MFVSVGATMQAMFPSYIEPGWAGCLRVGPRGEKDKDATWVPLETFRDVGNADSGALRSTVPSKNRTDMGYKATSPSTLRSPLSLYFQSANIFSHYSSALLSTQLLTVMPVVQTRPRGQTVRPTTGFFHRSRAFKTHKEKDQDIRGRLSLWAAVVSSESRPFRHGRPGQRSTG